MHGIFVGEIQALEGAGRTCWDFETGDGPRRRAVRAQARHGPPVLGRGAPLRDLRASSATGWAPSSASSPSTTFLYEAACNPDPVLRLTGVNRALEGLAIDVFNTMKEFGDIAGDPVLEFCEDWMLADEVTHVKMGSDWLRRLTENDTERRERALEFQRVVDKLFSLGGFRGEDDDSPIKLARRFRELAGFDRRRSTSSPRSRARRRRDADAQRQRLAAAGVWHDASPSRLTSSRSSTSTRPRSRRSSRSSLRDVGLPADLDVRIEVDESTPLGRATVDVVGPGRDHRRERRARGPEAASHSCRATGSADVLGRLLLRVRDRLDPAFGDPPDDDDLPLPQSVAWDVYCVGRLVRLGYKHYDNRQRRLYHFRNRHGFTDVADDAFERLWTADDLTWADIVALSDKAAAAAA